MLREQLAIPLREARAPLVLALDIGTSGLRVFLFDARARPIARSIAHTDRPVRTSSDGEATVDAEERLRAACGAIDAVLATAGRRATDIAAVAVSSFWHSLVGVDLRGRPTTRVLTWADTVPRSWRSSGSGRSPMSRRRARRPAERSDRVPPSASAFALGWSASASWKRRSHH